MSVAARQVLEDCREALKMLEDEEDISKWRIHWVGSLALIRAVGHVLEKVDGKNSSYTRPIREAYEQWRNDRESSELFWKFICAERNNILKEYQFNLDEKEFISIATTIILVNPETGEQKFLNDVFPIGNNIYRPLLGDFREGEDARDVYREAIDWWNNELTKIDGAAGFPRVVRDDDT